MRRARWERNKMASAGSSSRSAIGVRRRAWPIRLAYVPAAIACAPLAAAQQSSPPSSSAASAPTPAQEDTRWTVPAGAKVIIDRRTGIASGTLATEPVIGSPEHLALLNDFRLHPYAGTGPYPAVRVEPASAPMHTLYYPADQAKAGKLPIILWANGNCRNTSVQYTRFLGEVASHGYFVVANGRNDIPYFGLPVLVAPKPGDQRPIRAVNDPALLIAGLEWAIREDARRGGPYYKRLDTAHVVAIGQSCGGVQAFRAAKDPRIRAVAVLNNWFPFEAPNPNPANPPLPEWSANRLNIPGAMFTGGPIDLAYILAENAFAAIPEGVPVVKVHIPAMGHTGAYPRPDPRWTGAVVSWLDWVAKGSQAGRAAFAGPRCGLCGDKDVWLETKGID